MQISDKDLKQGGLGGDVYVRLKPAGTPDFEELRRSVLEFNGQLIVFGAEDMQHTVANSISAKRFTMTLLAVFAALALLLASIGIYGVLSYLVGQRTQEIGVRMALGAQRLHVLRMVLKDGIRMTLIGIGIGLVAALCLARFMSSIALRRKADRPINVWSCRRIAMRHRYACVLRAGAKGHESGSDHCVAAPIAEIAVQKHFPLSMLVCTSAASRKT